MANLGAPKKKKDQKKYPITIYAIGADIKKFGGIAACREFLRNQFEHYNKQLSNASN